MLIKTAIVGNDGYVGENCCIATSGLIYVPEKVASEWLIYGR